MSKVAAPTMSDKAPFRLESLRTFTPEVDAINDHLIIGLDNGDSRTRPFNLLRTTLAKRLKEKSYRLVGITSATPSAGKSFLSMNLAVSLSRVSDDPIIIVDLDLRRASLADAVGLEVECGVSNFLKGQVNELSSIAVRIDDTQLTLFPTKRVSKNTAELVTGLAFDNFISQLRDQTGQSIVLFDMPPAFANDDSMLILERLDAYVMVVDSGKTNREQVQEVLAMLEPVPCLGTILNRYSGGFADSYGYGYGASAYANYYD